MAQTKAEVVAERDALRADLAIIAERIRQEAIDRGWCPAYGEVMDEINEVTSEPHMRQCDEVVLTTFDGSVTIAFSSLTIESGPTLEEREEAVDQWFRDNVVGAHFAIDRVEEIDIATAEVS